MDKQLYLERIGFEGDVLPNLATLEALSRAHLETVPFENFDIHLGVPLHLDEVLLFRKIVLRRRGGFCYELSGMFAWLLREIGFDVDMLSSRVIRKTSVGTDFDHMALRVWCEGVAYLVDVGFGDGSTLPIPLRAGASRSELGVHYGLSPLGDELLYEVETADGSLKAYELSLVSRELSDFYAMCRHHQTSARSWFTKARICVMQTPTGTASLIDGEYKLAGHLVERILEGGDYLSTLREDFGIDLPRMPESKALSVEQRIRKQGLVWEHRARRAMAFASQLSPLSS